MYCKSCAEQIYELDKLSDLCPLCKIRTYFIHTKCNGVCGKNLKLFSFSQRSGANYFPHSICYNCDPKYHNTLSHFVKPVLAKHMKIMMLMINKSLSEEQWIDRFKECYKMIEDDGKNNKVHYMFTSEQMTQIRQIMLKYPLTDKNINMKNALVSLCMHPWELPEDIFCFGVCYFGNLGSVPNSATEAVEIIKRNNNKWKYMRYDIQP